MILKLFRVALTAAVTCGLSQLAFAQFGFGPPNNNYNKKPAQSNGGGYNARARTTIHRGHRIRPQRTITPHQLIHISHQPTHTKPPANTYKPPANTYKPPVTNNYKPPANTYKPPVVNKPPANTYKPPVATNKPPAVNNRPPVVNNVTSSQQQ